MAGHRNQHFWDILKDLAANVPYKVITHRYKVSPSSLSKFKDSFLETTVRIKDNVVDEAQMKFGFMFDGWGNTDKEYFDFSNEKTFTKKRK